MKEKIEELIKYYEERAKDAAEYYFKNLSNPEAAFLNMGMFIVSQHVTIKLKEIIKAFDSEDASKDTPDTL